MNMITWVRQQPCCECRRYGQTTAHHVTYGRGRGQKVPDDMTIPLCVKCHDDFHTAKGAFRDMDKAQRRAWQERMVHKYQTLYLYGRAKEIDLARCQTCKRTTVECAEQGGCDDGWNFF